jgi:hypothetical protein
MIMYGKGARRADGALDGQVRLDSVRAGSSVTEMAEAISTV